MACPSPPSSVLAPPESAPLPWLFDDIIEEILAFSSRDKRTLAACTRVARSWLPTASRYLFHTIALRASPTSVDDFITLVKSCERARRNIEELQISTANEKTHYDVSFSSLCELVRGLSNLRVLHLGQVNRLRVYNDGRLSRKDGWGPRLAVQRLTWGDVVGVDGEHMLDLLDLFSPVGELAFEPSMRFAGQSARMLVLAALADFTSKEKIQAESLTFRFSLHDDLQSRFLTALATTLDRSSLKRISNVSVPSFAELTELDNFIYDACAYLEELTLRIYSSGVDIGFQQRLAGADPSTITGLPSLGQCLRFHRIVIYVDLWPWHDPVRVRNSSLASGNAVSFAAAVSILETALQAPALQSVELVFFLRYHPLSVPKTLITPENVLARLQQLNWERLNDMNIRQGDLPSIFIRLNRSDFGTGKPWLADNLREIMDTRLKTRLSNAIRVV